MTGEGGTIARKSKDRRQARRDASDIANGVPLLGRAVPSADPGRSLLEIEDRRQFYPSSVFRPARTFRRWARLGLLPPRSVQSKRARRSLIGGPISFQVPKATLVCVRRGQRREVLFAKKRAGRGGMRRPRRNVFSFVVCRRR